MSVYVDPLLGCTRWGDRKQYDKVSHLVADSLEELHEFAETLGLRREWFQPKPGFPHYDLTERMRERAIGLGATPLTLRELIAWKRGDLESIGGIEYERERGTQGEIPF